MRGSVIALRIRDGSQVWKSYLVDAPKQTGTNKAGVPKYGPSGVPVASIIDSGISFFATSVEPRDIQPLIDAMAKYGLIDHRFDAADFIFK